MNYNEPINRSDIQRILSANYEYFVDERCRNIPIMLFEALFFYKYTHTEDIWSFSINTKEDFESDAFLYCKNISGVEFVFPLK